MTRKRLMKRVKKTIAVAMSTMLVMSSSSLHVLADTTAQTATDSNATINITFGDGTLENPEVTQSTTTITDPVTGNTTTIVDTITTGSGTNENGASVEFHQSEEILTITDPDGNILGQTGSDAGSESIGTTSETTTSEEIDITPADNQTTITGTTETTSDPGTFETISTTPETTTKEEIDVGYTGDISIDLEPGETKTVIGNTDESKLATENLTVPESYTKSETDEATGITTTTDVTVTPVLDSNGNTIGYTTTTKITTSDPDTASVTEQIGDSSTEIITGETTSNVVTNTTINLPEKPQASESLDETTGNKTTVTVEELFDTNGNVVGYQSTTIVTGSDGSILYSGNEAVWGTTTTTTTTETTPTTTTTSTNYKVTTTTTTVITEATTMSGQKIVATDRQVTASMSEVTSNGDHGHVATESIKPNLSIQPTDGNVNDNDLHNPIESTETGEFGDYDFMYEGNYGLESTIRVHKNPDSYNTTLVHQFILIDKNNHEHYVFCADLGTTAQKAYRYNMQNVEDATYYSDEDAKIITSIALNGYWGTDEGVGSLTAMKDSLTKARAEAEASGSDFPLSQEQINNLTAGQALTATQAAIWYYGNCNEDNKMADSNIAGVNYKGDNYSGYQWYVDSVDRAAVDALYDYLIHLPATTDDPTTTLITENNFASDATILVGNLASDENGNLLAVNTDDDDDNDVYNTAVTFSLSIVPSEINDDLIVTVYDSNNKPITKKRLVGDSSKDTFGRISQNADGSYTIDNLQLAEGLSITLNLSGTQHLDTGVYLYSSEMRGTTTSQTFVGIAQGERDVNLNVSLSFTVDEPTAQIESTSSGETREKTDKVTDTRTDTVSESKVKATVIVTTETEENTKRSWQDGWGYEVTPADPDDDEPTTPDKPDKPDKPETSDKPETEIPQTETPTAVKETVDDNDIDTGVLGAHDDLMAVAPATGDASTLWMLLAALSGSLLSGFSFFERKRKKNTLK